MKPASKKPATEPQPDQEKKAVYSEQEVSEKTGIALDAVKNIRQGVMIAGRDFIREQGCVRITSAGLDLLMSGMGVKKEGATLEPSGLHRLIVERVTLNPRLILAKTLSGDLVRVIVKPSPNWVRGMTLWKLSAQGELVTGCRHIEGDRYTYEFPSPRQRGRL